MQTTHQEVTCDALWWTLRKTYSTVDHALKHTFEDTG